MGKMRAAIAETAVSVAVESSSSWFQHYRSGIFDSAACGSDTDHLVGLVGYGKSDDGKAYFILRNSWGLGWGEQGYMRLKDEGDGDGICGVLTYANYPVTNW